MNDIKTYKSKNQKEEIIFSKVESYEQSIERICEMMILSDFYKNLKENDKILLKPNLLIPKNKTKNVTTNPAIVEGIIIALLKKIESKNIFLGDSPAFGSTKMVTKVNGIYEICQKYNVSLIDFDEEKLVKLETFHEIPIFKNYNDYKIINIPKIKTHSLTNFTCAVKNLYGLIPGANKTSFHVKLPEEKKFSKLLYELASYIKTDFTIVDGIEGMDKNGPNSGETRKIGVIIMGNNNFTIDFLCSKLVDIDYNKITYLKYAKEKKIDLEIDFINEIINDLKFPYLKYRLPDNKKPSIINSYLNSKVLKKIFNKFSSRPIIDPKKCINCNRCTMQCPAKAISKSSKIPIFDYTKCVRCYCCQEVCPQNAIHIKKGFDKLFK
ncbi:MAG: DUF362 domain-containing protein [Candidatus Nanoarchaeia archaeon]|nr:DUF362 domain-containing protein [Candidatus Nanoarchaeia archaeon]